MEISFLMLNKYLFKKLADEKLEIIKPMLNFVIFIIFVIEKINLV